MSIPTIRGLLKGLSTYLNDEVSGLSGHLDTKVSGLSTYLNDEVSGLSTHLDTKVSGLSGHISTRTDSITTNVNQQANDIKGAIQVADIRISNVEAQVGQVVAQLTTDFLG